MGIIFFMLSSLVRLKGNFIKSFYFSIIALGFLFASGFYFFRETGDVANILKIVEIEVRQIWLTCIGFLIIGLSTIEFWIKFSSIEEEYKLLYSLREYKLKTQNSGTNPRYQRNI